MSESEKFSVDYAFTITLRPKCFVHEPEKQYDDTSEYVRRKLSSLSQAYSLIAEATKSYNVHYHGVIKFVISHKVDYMKEFHRCFRNDNLVGFVNIRQIDDFNRWVDYLKKDISRTQRSICRRPIIWDYYDLFDSFERADYGVMW